jgi:hypothetical protein
MKFYIINNDNIPLEHPIFHKAWIEDGYAFTSGEEQYGKKLERLEKDDYLFCYVKGVGVVACGKVTARADGKKYKHALYENRSEQGEVYKIKVCWYKDLTNSAIPYHRLVGCGPFSVTQTLQEIREINIAMKILELAESS